MLLVRSKNCRNYRHLQLIEHHLCTLEACINLSFFVYNDIYGVYSAIIMEIVHIQGALLIA
jgi:hypothetical protein